MANTDKRRRRRRAPSDPLPAEIEEVKARAAMVGLRFAGEKLTAWLPQSRCTPEERDRAQRMADEAGISLSEHTRRRASAEGASLVVVS